MNVIQMSEPRIITINGIPFPREGQGALPAKSYTSNGVKPYKPPPVKSDIRRDIYNACYHANRALSAKDIAQQIGRPKSCWLQRNLDVLVARGSLIRIEKPRPSRWKKYYYEVAR